MRHAAAHGHHLARSRRGGRSWSIPEDTDAIAQGLRKLLEDAALRQRLVDGGFANLTRFSWERTAERVSTLIEELLAQ